MAFVFYVNAYEFAIPPRFTVSSKHASTGRGDDTWEETWRFEGLLACAGIEDAKSKWDALRKELELKNFKSFSFRDDEDNTVILERNSNNCYLYPKLDELSFPSSGEDAAWATNLRYSFTVTVILKPADKNELYRDVTLRFQIDELGFTTVTESGKVSYNEPCYRNPLPLFILAHKTPSSPFRIRRQSYDWTGDRKECSYSIDWSENTVPTEEFGMVVAPRFSVSLRTDFFTKSFSVEFSFRVPKGARTPERPKFSESEIVLIPPTKTFTWAPDNFVEGVPTEVKALVNKVARALKPKRGFDAKLDWSWDAEQRSVRASLSYSIPFYGDIVGLQYSLTYTPPIRKSTEISRLRGFPIVYRSGTEPASLNENITCDSLVYPQKGSFATPGQENWLKVSEQEKFGPSRYLPDGKIVYSMSYQCTWKIFETSQPSLAALVNQFHQKAGVMRGQQEKREVMYVGF